MKKVYLPAKHQNNILNFLSRRLLVLLLSACTLMATACQKEEEVKPDTGSDKIAQASRDITAIKPVTINIKSGNQNDKGGN